MSTFVNPWNDFSTEFKNTTDKTHNTPSSPSQTAQTSTDKTSSGEGFVTDKTPSTDLLARAEKLPEPAMPPDIQAAYDRGESVIFSKERGRWELYKVLEPPVDLSDEALDLMDMYHQGELPEQVHEQLTELFTENPADIEERLETAALFVKQQTKTSQKPSAKTAQSGLFDPPQERVRIININTAIKEEQASAHYVGRENKGHNLRESALHNPVKDDDRLTSIAKFREYLPAQLKKDPTAAQEFSSLLGTLAQEGSVTLMCWCVPKPCHAEVIRDLLLESTVNESEKAA